MLQTIASLLGEGTRRRVLVVDDEPDARELARRVLTSGGYLVDEVPNGVAAMRYLARERPDLILLDLMMPEVDGFHVITELQLNEAWREIPVVVFTAMDVPPARMTFLESHVESVIRKGGYGQDRMLEEVRGLIARSLG